MVKNTYSGKFIVFEGLDGSGKSTQTKLLIKRLKREGYKVATIDFPQHGEKSASLVDEYLRGKYGTAEEVGPYRGSIFYACDRYDAGFKIRKWLEDGKIVIADRYLASNIGHQGGKIIENKEEWRKFLKWLYDLEYNIFEIPRPNFNIILKTSPAFSLKLAHKVTDEEKKAKREAYLGDSSKQDIHESDKQHLANTLTSYLEAAKEYPQEFKVIECIENNNLLAPEVIHEKVWKLVEEIL